MYTNNNGRSTYYVPPPRYSQQDMSRRYQQDVNNVTQLFGVGVMPGGAGNVQFAFPLAGMPLPTVQPADYVAGHEAYVSQVPAPAQGSGAASNQVGWGGQVINDSNHRVPWFGRSRSKYPRSKYQENGNVRQDSSRRNNGEGSFHGPSPAAAASMARAPEDAMSVEQLVALLQKLGKREPMPERVHRAMYHLDSRALALLLKDLSRVGLDDRAVELFDHLRSLGDRHALRGLCDVYTYTAMISLCIYQQDVDRALELVEDMRQRGIERNVHTYTALMNVCIKCGKLQLALDIYHSMKRVNCPPNVVTYNTLIDVYGKLGQWERAIQVIDMIKREGVEPVLRTYNTLIIACNMCNQPREALGVYHRLLADGYAPNSTTYNALISAYGKTGQLEKALDIYHEMLRQNMDRSVITFSSLISACEKAGQWETALKIFAEMQQDGCAPNTVTFNSLITACAQGGQWEKASEVFEQMALRGCTPDVVTYTALISAFERGGQWQKALQAFHKMCLQGCKPDAIVYNAIIDTLWETGVVWAQNKALQLFSAALQQGQFRQEAISPKHARVELNLHAMTAGVAMLSLYCWLEDIRRVVVEKGAEHLPHSLAIVTDVGKASREQGNCIVKEAVAAMMNFWEAPFRPTQDNVYSAILEAPSGAVAEWVTSEVYTAQMASIFPFSEANKLADENIPVREQQVMSDCGEAFGAVGGFEATHGLVLPNMSPAYVAQRPALISRLLDYSSKLGLHDEVVHDAVLLMDRTASQAKQVPENVLPLVACAALVIASKQGEGTDTMPTSADIERVMEFPATAIAKMEWNIRGLLDDDTSAISTMRCLKVYLERLGFRFLDKQGVYGMAGFAIMLAVESLYDLSLLNCRPSVVASALLYAERRLRGAVPFWPTMLSKMTGYEDMATPELTVAVRVAQKLSRKLVYAQMYKAQLTALSNGAVEALQPLPTEWHSYDLQQVSAVGKPTSPTSMAAALAVERELAAQTMESLAQAMQALSTAAKAVAGPASVPAPMAVAPPSVVLAAAQNWSLSASDDSDKEAGSL